MNDEERKVEEIMNESLNDIAYDVDYFSNIESIRFEDIKKLLENEAQKIEEVKRINITVSFDDRDAQIKEINENDELTPEQKQEEIAKIEEYYEKARRLVGGNQIDNLKEILEKTRSLMNEKKEEIDYEINSLDASDDFEEKINIYNENVAAISDFSNNSGIADLNYKTYNVDASKIKEDSIIFSSFESSLNKSGINFENLDEKVDIINDLLDRNPNCYKVIDAAQSLAVIGLNVLDNKRKELEQIESKINLTHEESRIYDSCKTDQEFVDKMIEKDTEAQKINLKIENIDNEIQQLKSDMDTLDENSDEYKQLENKINERINISDDLKSDLASIKENYMSRKHELDEFDRKNGEEIEKFNKIYEKIKELKSRSKKMMQNYNFNKNNKKIDYNTVNEEHLDGKDLSSQEPTEENVNEENKDNVQNNSDVKNGSEEKSKKDYIVDNNNGSNLKENKSSSNKSLGENIKGIDEKDSVSKDLKEISEPQSAKNIVDDFLKLTNSEQKLFLTSKNGYSKLLDAIAILSNNNEGFSLSKKERKSVLDAINAEMKFSLKEEKVNESKDKILDLFFKLNGENKDEGIALFNELFTYNKATKLPFISTALIEKKDQEKLGKIMYQYSKLLESGGLDVDEIANFEKFILNPLNANSIRHDISNMGFLGKLKNLFNNRNTPFNNRINCVLKDINELTKNAISIDNSNSSMKFSDSIYSGEEISMNEIDRIINEDKQTKEKTSEDIYK